MARYVGGQLVLNPPQGRMENSNGFQCNAFDEAGAFQVMIASVEYADSGDFKYLLRRHGFLFFWGVFIQIDALLPSQEG